MDVLIVLASVASYLSGVLLLVVSMADPSKPLLANDHQMLDAAPTLISTIFFGKAIESAARGQASNGLRALVALQPCTALLCKALSTDSFSEKATTSTAAPLAAADRVTMLVSDLQVGQVCRTRTRTEPCETRCCAEGCLLLLLLLLLTVATRLRFHCLRSLIALRFHAADALCSSSSRG